jgi:hypothetical protein
VDPLFVERKRLRGDSTPFNLEAAAKEINARITSQFDDVDTVIEECGLSTLTMDFDDARAISDKEDAICMELAMVKTFPFPLEAVAEAVWQCLSAEHIALPNGFYSASQRSESQADLKFAVTVRVRRSEAVVHVRGVGARRSTADRMIAVFETVAATEGQLFADQGISCRERAYMVVEKAPVASDALSPSTITRVCVRLWPESDGRDATANGTPKVSQVGLFVDLVLGSYNKNVKTMLQFIENTLLARPSHGTS